MSLTPKMLEFWAFQTSGLSKCLSCFKVYCQPGQGPQGHGWRPVLPAQTGGRNCLPGGWALQHLMYSPGHMREDSKFCSEESAF